jgi:8-amino-7-oxononanoate synthase
LAAIEIMENEPERIQNLWDLSNYSLKCFNDLGFDTGKSESPIIPLFIRDDIKALTLTKLLFEQGIFVNPVVSPAVPKSDCLIRFSLMATHTKKQIDTAVSKIYETSKALDIPFLS